MYVFYLTDCVPFFVMKKTNKKKKKNKTKKTNKDLLNSTHKYKYC